MTAAAADQDQLRKTFGGAVAEKDEAALALVALRDVAIGSALLSLFGAAEAWALVSGLAFAKLLSVVVGALVGAAVGALLHEWGHFAGARLGGGHAPLKPVSKFPPLFDFDYANNDNRSFHWMSVGGNIAHIAFVLLLLIMIPTHTAGSAALISGAIAFAVFSSKIEFPVIARVQGGATGIEALSAIPRDFVQRTLPWALGAGALSFLIL